MLQTTKLISKNEFTVVRISTSFYTRGKSICKTKSLRIVKSKSSEEDADFVETDISVLGEEDFIYSILNFDQCEDGLYRILPMNFSRDWETGYIDSYDYKLIPYDDTEKIQDEKIPDTTG